MKKRFYENKRQRSKRHYDAAALQSDRKQEFNSEVNNK